MSHREDVLGPASLTYEEVKRRYLRDEAKRIRRGHDALGGRRHRDRGWLLAELERAVGLLENLQAELVRGTPAVEERERIGERARELSAALGRTWRERCAKEADAEVATGEHREKLVRSPHVDVNSEVHLAAARAIAETGRTIARRIRALT